MSEWFENEEFWIQFAPIMFDDARWAEAPTVAEYVKNISHARTVLDAGCGIGRIAVELAGLGLDVTGVDIIQSELDAAAESAEAEGVPLKLIKADLRAFSESEKYDSVINLYTSFGYCDTEEEDMRILLNMANAVKKGGTFIMECTSRETAILYFTKGEEFERAGYKVATDFDVVGAWEGLRSHWALYSPDVDLLKDSDVKPLVDHCFVQRLYPAAFLRDKLKEFGLKQVDVYGDFDKSPYDQHARTMVIIGKK